MKITPIDPNNVTNYNRTTPRLEEFILFCIFVAGKNSQRMAEALAAVLQDAHEQAGLTRFAPFEALRTARNEAGLLDLLRCHRVGTYKMKGGAIHTLIHRDIDLKTCTVDELESIPGIGMKTARFFLLHSRPNQPYAVLDRHVLRYMENRWRIDVPRDTPSSPRKYRELEQRFLELASKEGNVADLDLDIYRSFPRGNERYASILSFW